MNRKEFITVIKSTYREFQKDDVPLLGAGLTYYTLLSLFPLLLLAVSLLTNFLKPQQASEFIFRYVAQYVPGSTELLHGALDEASKHRPNAGWFALFSIGLLTFSASNAFGVLDRAINRAWNTEKVPNFFVGKLISLVMMIVVAVLLLASTLASTVLTTIRAVTTQLFGEVTGTQVVWQFGNLGLSLATIFVLFLLIYRFLPRAEVTIRDVWLGALLAAVAWVALKELFALFVGSSFARFDAVYGTMGALIALLTWMYFSAIIILVGAEFTAQTQHVRRLRVKAGAALTQSDPSPWLPNTWGGTNGRQT